MADTISILINIGVPLGLLIIAYFVGSFIERRHFADIRKREAAMHGFPALTTETIPDDWQVTEARLMVGSIVVSLDYFKRIVAGLRSIIGGRIKTYEPLLDRARREAMLRLLEQSRQAGYDAVINVRLETSRMANARGDEGTAGVEMLAIGTAIKMPRMG
ncbi:MAG: heavy metal-binding domain-containing protein [Pseudomonadota bacterium]